MTVHRQAQGLTEANEIVIFPTIIKNLVLIPIIVSNQNLVIIMYNMYVLKEKLKKSEFLVSLDHSVMKKITIV